MVSVLVLDSEFRGEDHHYVHNDGRIWGRVVCIDFAWARLSHIPPRTHFVHIAHFPLRFLSLGTTFR